MLVKFGGGIVDARGSLAGNTFSRNRYGAYVRARVTPVNPNSLRQSTIRSIVSAVAANWLAVLTSVQRDAWAVFAAAVPATNKLGEVINLSGFNQYMKSNIAALNVDGTAILDAPLIFTLPGEDSAFSTEVDAGTQLITVVFDDTRDWIDETDSYLIIQAGQPVNASINFFNGPWRHAGVIAGDDTVPPTTPDSTITYPFIIGDGQRAFVRAKILKADGRLSDWFRDSSIVATA